MASPFTRRTFLRGSAAVGLSGLSGTTVLGRQTKKPARRGPNEEIRTAILGIHNQGRHHIGYHQASDNIRIVTLCDPDTRLFADRVKLVNNGTPKTETDLHRVLDDPDVDCVSIAMPNSWHALATVWACQAGKDVYVEKPATWCIAEGPLMMKAAKKYDRVVQVGTQYRAKKGCQEAMQQLRDGVIGKIFMAEALFRRTRESIGNPDNKPVPDGVDYDLWCGPAPKKPFNDNRFHYEWHWFWDYGNGEIGNNGPHVADLAIQGLGKDRIMPVRVTSRGGRFAWQDQGETPNIQITDYHYDDGMLLRLDVRSMATPDEVGSGNSIIFYGDKGHLVLRLDGRYETMVNGEAGPSGSGGGAHPELIANFYEVMRSRNRDDLLAPLESGHVGAAVCHLGNIAYRLGRPIQFDPATETFGNDREANAFLTRDYRAPYTMPRDL